MCKRHVQTLFICWMIHTRCVCVCCAWCSMGLRSAHILCTLFLHQIFGHGAFFPLLLADAAAVCQHACGFGWNHLFGKNWFISWDSYECHEIVSTTKTIRHNRTEKTITFSLSSQLTFPHFVRIVASVSVCNIALSQPYPLFLSIESPIRSLCAVQETVFFYLLRPTHPFNSIAWAKTAPFQVQPNENIRLANLVEIKVKNLFWCVDVNIGHTVRWNGAMCS